MFKWLDKLINCFKPSKEKVSLKSLKFGCKPDIEDNRDYKKTVKAKVSYTPNSFSLKKYIAGGILNQRNTSACTGYAGAYALGILINRQNEILAKNDSVKFKHVSPTYIYYNARKIEGFDIKEDSGSTLRSIMKALANPGAIDISAMKDTYSVTSEPPANVKDLPKYTISSYSRIYKDDSTIETMLRTLDTEHLPIVCGIILYVNQVDASYYNNGILDYSNVKEDKELGGHAVCITGYKYINNKLYFEIVNSWGSLYGVNGFCYIPASMVTTDDMMDIWTFNKNYF